MRSLVIRFFNRMEWNVHSSVSWGQHEHYDRTCIFGTLIIRPCKIQGQPEFVRSQLPAKYARTSLGKNKQTNI